VLLVADLDIREPAIAAIGVENAGPLRNVRSVRIDLIARSFARQRKAREIGAPIFVQQHRKRGRPLHFDSSRSPGLTAGAVTSEQILGVPILAAARFNRADLADNAVLSLLEADKLRREVHLDKIGVLD